MAKLRSGILGQVSGKVSGVVGGTWKDKNYVREYVIPANPNTAGQQTQRGLFANCVDFAKLCVGPIFNIYTDKFIKDMSGYNFFIKRNISLFTTQDPTLSVKVTEGKLFKPQALTLAGVANTDQTTITWSTAKGNNGADTDAVYGLVWNVTQHLITFFPTEYPRLVGTCTITSPQALNDILRGFIFAAKKTGSVIDMISDSTSVQGASGL